LGDYLHPPKITVVEQTDDIIRIRAEDEVKVTRVSVSVSDAAGHPAGRSVNASAEYHN
jgi:hypothetical protein